MLVLNWRLDLISDNIENNTADLFVLSADKSKICMLNDRLKNQDKNCGKNQRNIRQRRR